MVYTIGQRVRALRQAQGLTQGELAQRMGTYQVVASHLENDKREPSLLQLRRVSKALGVPVAEILPPPQDTFCDRMRFARLAADMSQERLAEATGSSLTTIHFIENGERDPRLSQLKAIAQALNVSIAWLVAGVSEN